MIAHGFVVLGAQWFGGISDSLRLTKGNVFLSEAEANEVCLQLNERLEQIRNAIDGERQKERIIEDAARKKKEAAERKEKRDDDACKDFSGQEKAIRYEVNKQKRTRKAAAMQKKPPHPDIIV